MKNYNGIIILILLLILISGCSTNSTISDNKKLSNEKTMVESIEWNELSIKLDQLPNIKESEAIFDILEETYYYVVQVNYRIVDSIDNLEDSSISTEIFCEEIDRGLLELEEIKQRLANLVLSSEIELYNDLMELRGMILAKNNLVYNQLKTPDSYCEDNSNLKFNYTLNSGNNLRYYTYNFEDRAEEVSSYGTQTWDQEVYSMLNNIKEKLKTSN